jgi:hypothetical protein
MLCGRCEAVALGRPAQREWRRSEPTPGGLWGAARLRGLLCADCGAVPAALDVAQGLLLKRSQLAQFGLAGTLPLLGAAPPEDG